MQQRIEDHRRSVSAERHASRGHLIKYGAEREQVGAGVEFFAPGLLGRHVGHRAYRGSRAGQVFLDGCAFGGGRVRAGQLGQSEVEDFGLPAFGDENVRRLDVAVHDFLGVRGIKRIGDFDGQGEQGLGVHGLARDAVLQRDPVEKLHGDEGLAVLLANVVNGADVGMIQGGSGLGLALEAGQGLRVAGDFLGQKLEGHKTMKPRVFRLIDHAHTAAAQLLDNAVVRNGLSDH